MVLLSDLDIVSCNMRFWTVRLSDFSEIEISCEISSSLTFIQSFSGPDFVFLHSVCFRFQSFMSYGKGWNFCILVHAIFLFFIFFSWLHVTDSWLEGWEILFISKTSLFSLLSFWLYQCFTDNGLFLILMTPVAVKDTIGHKCRIAFIK